MTSAGRAAPRVLPGVEDAGSARAAASDQPNRDWFTLITSSEAMIVKPFIVGLGAVLALTPGPARVIPLNSTAGLRLTGVRAAAVRYRGRDAVRLTVSPHNTSPDALTTLALIDGGEFSSGTIEVLVASTLAPDADTSARGFVGLVFRSSDDGSRFENVYLRPLNGRAPQQLRRNHAVQYESIPDYPWDKLRRDTPGQYESYSDLQPGVWTKMRLVVDGPRAQLFINDAPQPCLVVNDLKLARGRGGVGLWIGPGTIGYFSRLSFTPDSRSAAGS